MKEIYKVFEDVTTNNVKAILDHGNATRKLVIEMEKQLTILELMIKSQRGEIALLRTQLAAIQAKVYSGGTV